MFRTMWGSDGPRKSTEPRGGFGLSCKMREWLVGACMVLGVLGDGMGFVKRAPLLELFARFVYEGARAVPYRLGGIGACEQDGLLSTDAGEGKDLLEMRLQNV